MSSFELPDGGQVRIWKYSPSHSRLVLRRPFNESSTAFLLVGVSKIVLEMSFEARRVIMKLDSEKNLKFIFGPNSIENYVYAEALLYKNDFPDDLGFDYFDERIDWMAVNVTSLAG